MLRRVILILCALAAPLPAMAANKDIERLQIQISALQGQIALPVTGRIKRRFGAEDGAMARIEAWAKCW